VIPPPSPVVRRWGCITMSIPTCNIEDSLHATRELRSSGRWRALYSSSCVFPGVRACCLVASSHHT